MRARMRVCVCAHTQWICDSQRLAVSFPHVGLGDRIQAVRFSAQHPYPLNCFIGLTYTGDCLSRPSFKRKKKNIYALK